MPGRRACSRCGWGCLEIYTLLYLFSPLSPSFWETTRYRLKYCLKGPLNPKQQTMYIENTILVCFDIKFIRRDQKQLKNGEACRGSLTFFGLSLINLISKDTCMVFYLSYIICGSNGEKTEKQTKSRRSFVHTC